MPPTKTQDSSIYNWEEWCSFCAEQNEDPYENCEIGFDLGGGDSYSIVYRGDYPEKK